MIREFITTALKGFAMGAANVIPGVSGGTIAVVTGIYERLINALKNLGPTTLKLVFSGKIREAWQKCDGTFLLAIAVGAIASLVTLAKVLEWAFAEAPTLVWGFFFGLILASIYYVGRTIRQWSTSVIILAILGAALAAGMAFLTPASENAAPWYLLLCGVAGMCSMIIPGVSGSFVLLLMGNYYLIVITGINSLRSFDFATALPLLVPVGIGAVLGLVVLAKALSWLFKNHHDRAMGLVTGFIAGSLVIIYPWKVPGEVEVLGDKEKVLSYDYFPPDVSSAFGWQTIGLIVAGVLVMAITEKLGSRDEKS